MYGDAISWGTPGDTREPLLLVGVPKDISPNGTNEVAGAALVVLIRTSRHSLATTIRELWKNEDYSSQVLNATQPGPPAGRRSSEHRPGFHIYWGPSVGWLGRNQRAGRAMWGPSLGYLGFPRLSRKKNIMSGAGLGAYLEAVIQLAKCLFKTGVWKGCFSDQKLSARHLASDMFTPFPITASPFNIPTKGAKGLLPPCRHPHLSVFGFWVWGGWPSQ